MSSSDSASVLREELRLWPALGAAKPSPAQWHEAILRGRAVGWVRLRGSTTSALSALSTYAMPHLEDLREALATPADHEPVVQRIGALRAVNLVVPALSRGASGQLQLELAALRVFATPKWAVTFDPATSAAVDGVLERVDLEVGADSHPNGHDLALRILLALAEWCDSVAKEAARELEGAKGNVELTALQSVLDGLDRNIAAVRRRGRPAETAWWPPHVGSKDAEGIAEVLDDALATVRAARDESTRREMRLRTEAERRSAEALQIVLGTIAAVLLGPSLVAGIFDAFPGWQPVDRRDDSFIGLSLASAGALWLIVYVVPALLARRRNASRGTVAAVAVGLVPLIVGLILALPLTKGVDDNPPAISVSCPVGAVVRGSEVLAAVAASDAEGPLANDPSGVHRLPTDGSGPATQTFRAVDAFGNAATAACTYRIKPVPRRSRRNAGIAKGG